MKFFLSFSLLTMGAIACNNFMPSAIAVPQQLNITISTKQSQSYPNLLQEAETKARDAIQQSFRSSKGITDIAVYISGERYGQKVPLMSSVVSQSAWQKNPQIKSWSKYFRDAEVLLGFTGSTQVASRAMAAAVIERRSPYPSENEPNFYR